MSDDKALVGQVLQGNARACQTLVERHQRLVLHMVGRMVRQPEDAEDLCQEVFIKVYQHLPEFQFDAKLSTWIATIAYRTGLNYLKKRGYAEPLEAPEPMLLTADDPTPADALVREDEKQFLQKQIEKLPLHYRTVLTLYHLDGFSYEEIRRVTNLPEGTVKNYLFRARQLLKEALQRHQPRESWL